MNSMASPVSYDLDGQIATIKMDDGKVNALSLEMQAGLRAALNQAQEDKAIVVLRGRDGVFSGGFDLKVLRAGGADAVSMLRGGFELAEQILSHPTPVIMACSGHAIAMASFLLLTADYRIGIDGPFKVQANEVAIGLTMPLSAIELCRHRLTPACFNRAILLSEVFVGQGAVEAGFLDRAVPESEYSEAVAETANSFLALDLTAHAASKVRVREEALRALRVGMASDEDLYARMTPRDV
jgi:enoyl-CoA hydratase